MDAAVVGKNKLADIWEDCIAWTSTRRQNLRAKINHHQNKLIFLIEHPPRMPKQKPVTCTIAVTICPTISQSKNDCWLMWAM